MKRLTNAEKAEIHKQLEEAEKTKFKPYEDRIAELEEQLEAERNLNEEIKARFVKCNTCTDEMKEKCLMFSEDLCQGERCEELVDLMGLISKSELQKENAELKEKLEIERNARGDWFGKAVTKDRLLTEAKEIIKIGLEGIKREFIVAGNTRPYAKEALELCNEYCEKAEAFLKE